jgi:uncharacterized protein
MGCATAAAVSSNVRMTGKGHALGVLFAGLLVVLGWAMPAAAAPNYPELAGRITDNANLLKPEDRAAIEAELAALETKSTDQIAVVTVSSLEGYAIEDYGIGLARKWQIGQKGKDNGILLIVAPNEKKVRIEVGRRLEPVMTDTMSKIIVQNAILTKFRRGDFSGGIRDGVRDIKDVLLGDAEAVKDRAKGGRMPQSDPTLWIHLAVWVAIIAFIIWANYRSTQQLEQNMTPEQRRRMRRRGQRPGSVVVIPGGSSDWGGGWSGGGGGGGGWSGGGGDFGGGGASGDW